MKDKILCCPRCGNTALRTFLDRVPLVQNPEGNWEIPEVSIDELNNTLSPDVDIECSDPHCGPCSDENGNTVALTYESTEEDYWREFTKATGKLSLVKADASDEVLDEFDSWCAHLIWEHWEGKVSEAADFDEFFKNK